MYSFSIRRGIAKGYGGYSIFTGVGERSREGNDLWSEMKESGVLEKTVLLGRMPSAVGYQPTLANEMGELQERMASTKNGSVTSVQAVYVPADDLTDLAPATTFAHLDATTVLSRKIVEQGIYPAVDPLESNSRILEEDVFGKGFAQMMNNRAKILVDTAEYPEEIDMRRAKEAEERAKEQLRQKQSIREYYRSQASLARAMSRLRYGRKL